MKLKYAIVGLTALFGLAAAGSASAMPVAPLSPASNFENVVVVELGQELGLAGQVQRKR